MAERIQVELVDDIDGSPAQDTVTFALDGVTYEIDLSERHARQLRSTLGRYIERARRAERASKASKKQESEERQARQANRQLTEQIRGAAQRTRERLSQRAQEESKQEGTGQETELPELAVPELTEDKPGGKDAPVPAVSLPQFSSASD
jgi:hypothetical protein